MRNEIEANSFFLCNMFVPAKTGLMSIEHCNIHIITADVFVVNVSISLTRPRNSERKKANRKRLRNWYKFQPISALYLIPLWFLR